MCNSCIRIYKYYIIDFSKMTKDIDIFLYLDCIVLIKFYRKIVKKNFLEMTLRLGELSSR